MPISSFHIIQIICPRCKSITIHAGETLLIPGEGVGMKRRKEWRD
jgi:hypothetical protein